VSVFGQSTFIHGILGLFSADNLGAHSLFGFLESVSAKYICRFCLADKEEIQVKFLASDFERRTRQHVDICVSRMNDSSAKYNASDTGIKRMCILNDLKYFHCTKQSAVDCMHDVLEGIIPYEIAIVIQSLIDKGIFTLAQVNEALFHFNYSNSDKNSKSPLICLPNI